MTIKVGDTIPSMKLMMATPEGPKEVSTDDIFKGKKVVLFAVPGAFTPTCSAKHLPGFVQNADAIKAKGVDTVACISVNDAFVMGAWGKDQGTDGKVTMLADGAAAFAKALGLELDLNARGMGWRSQRYALVAENGKVTHLAVEQPGNFDVSKAESILGALPGDNTTDEPLPRALAGDNTTDDPRPIFTKRKT
jgi:peroxiredoxin (alkyl hydroperoxide reductase subunit C)